MLKTVYVRVLEDRGLLQPSRLLDEEAQHLFEHLAPNLGDTAFLRWIFRDLASAEGGLPELFSLQPAEVAQPSNALSRDLIAFWRHQDPDTGARWSFVEERFEGELMGDLYQELDPVVKARYALCQTPDFVRAFMLDRTLSPAIETFGADTVRLLDPACGSGHLLIDGFKRLFAATQTQHPDWTPLQIALHVLDRVVGIDINDYACGLARTRLVMTAAEQAGVRTLVETGQFHPHIYWADGLEQVERATNHATPLPALAGEVEVQVRASFTRSDVRKALKKVFQPKFHAVLANPPYITEKDPARKDYHRERTGANQRYISAYREYSLASPFTERCFQLAVPGGFVGLIVSNNFMKREFGKPLIERVLAFLDLTLVVDTSQAYIPFHGTPTVMLFGRNQSPLDSTIRAVMGKRGESGVPEIPSEGRVWSSLVAGWNQVGFENEYVSVTDLPRETLSRHPWSLGGGGASELKETLSSRASRTIGDMAESIGFMCITKQDDVFVQDHGVFLRKGCELDWTRPFGMGDMVRNWCVSPGPHVLFPYDERIDLRNIGAAPGAHTFLWPFRRTLEARAVFGGSTFRTAGRSWWEYGQIPRDRFRTPLSIAFAFVATHNHFVFDRGGKVFKQSAPLIKLPPEATEDNHLALLGLLNSSTACFWMKQVFHNKRGSGDGKGMRESWMDRFEFDSTKMLAFPVVRTDRVLPYAQSLDSISRLRMSETVHLAIQSALGDSTQQTVGSLRQSLNDWQSKDWVRFRQMVGLQEELDWCAYEAYGLYTSEVLPVTEALELVPGERPFEIAFEETNREASESDASLRTDWFSLQGWEAPSPNWPEHLGQRAPLFKKRLDSLKSVPALRLIETPDYKRRWYRPDYEAQEQEALRLWLADRVEAEAKTRTRVFTLEHLVAALQDDARVLAVCEVLTGRRDFNLATLVREILQEESVPSHPYHIFKPSGLVKRAAWERTWAEQRREDSGEALTPNVPKPYAPVDFLRPDYWSLRGKLDVPKERFTTYTEAPGRTGDRALFGWAGWTPLQRLRALLALDETLEEEGVPASDRLGLLDSAWRLLPDAAREDAAAANRLKAELQPLVGLEGPSEASLEDWKRRFPPPRAARAAGRRRTRPEAESEEL